MLSERRQYRQNNHVPLVFWGYMAVSSQVAARQWTSASSCTPVSLQEDLSQEVRHPGWVARADMKSWLVATQKGSTEHMQEHLLSHPVFGTSMHQYVLVEFKSKYPNNPLTELSFTLWSISGITDSVPFETSNAGHGVSTCQWVPRLWDGTATSQS